jgi:hypothetical protein
MSDIASTVRAQRLRFLANKSSWRLKIMLLHCVYMCACCCILQVLTSMLQGIAKLAIEDDDSSDDEAAVAVMAKPQAAAVVAAAAVPGGSSSDAMSLQQSEHDQAQLGGHADEDEYIDDVIGILYTQVSCVSSGSDI